MENVIKNVISSSLNIYVVGKVTIKFIKLHIDYLQAVFLRHSWNSSILKCEV
jgi:hypothetical protein